MKTMETQTKEKLEFRHLAPYLPYELKVKRGGRDIQTMDVDGDEYASITGVLYSATIKDGMLKPILIPLSIFNRMILKDVMSFLGCTFNQGVELFDLIQRDKLLNDISVGLYSKLCEKHIDFNNLIKKGLAIDKNSL